MSQETELLESLLNALSRRDHAAMAALYHPDATFEDEVFQVKGPEIGRMWHMLCSRGKDMVVTYDSVRSPAAGKATANWHPVYTFSQSGRKVINHIATEIEVKDGKIWRQRDRFSFWRWSSQALGTPGMLLGWTPMLKNKVRRTAMTSLTRFQTS